MSKIPKKLDKKTAKSLAIRREYADYSKGDPCPYCGKPTVGRYRNGTGMDYVYKHHQYLKRTPEQELIKPSNWNNRMLKTVECHEPR